MARIAESRRLRRPGALLAALLPLAVGAQQLAMEPVPPTPVAANPAEGKALYERHCAQCHGGDGKGDGPAADFVYPRPRDFTLAVFKLRSTPTGQLPTDHDLFRVISEGMPGTSMPGWRKFLSERERWQLVHHVKTLDTLDLFKEEAPKEQVTVTGAPKITPELIARGRALYVANKCGDCHGALGRGDGPSALTQKDDWGHAIRPVNFTKGWRFRGGDRIEDIYRTFTTGFNGTPMPSFVKAIPEAADRWALAAYVKSLTQPRRAGEVIRALRAGSGVPADPWDARWDETPAVDILLAGQIVLEPRWFTPAHDVLAVRALYDERELALLLEWDDGTHDRAPGRPADQVAVQFPARLAADAKPFFMLGDARHPVDRWLWNAATGLSRASAAGARSITTRPPGALSAAGAYREGQYRVVLRRPLAAAEAGDIEFEPGVFAPIAFQLWDGHNGEEDMKMAISAWYSLRLEPPVPRSAYLWPLAAGVLALGGQIALASRLRRRRERS
jgi:DMSO reductase family type II enzyme heme b subunit